MVLQMQIRVVCVPAILAPISAEKFMEIRGQIGRWSIHEISLERVVQNRCTWSSERLLDGGALLVIKEHYISFFLPNTST